jgi:hypothetical protein
MKRYARRARYRNIIPIGKWITPLKFKATPVDDQACEKAISESKRNKCLPAQPYRPPIRITPVTRRSRQFATSNPH